MLGCLDDQGASPALVAVAACDKLQVDQTEATLELTRVQLVPLQSGLGTHRGPIEFTGDLWKEPQGVFFSEAVRWGCKMQAPTLKASEKFLASRRDVVGPPSLVSLRGSQLESLRTKVPRAFRRSTEGSVWVQAVGNDHFCDTTERASQRLFSSYKGGFPCITEVGRNPLIPQP